MIHDDTLVPISALPYFFYFQRRHLYHWYKMKMRVKEEDGNELSTICR